jgi:nucleotide-binding universal stress UspA family protein
MFAGHLRGVPGIRCRGLGGTHTSEGEAAMSEPHFTHILAPVDLSDASTDALHFAAVFARMFAAKVTILYADELTTLFADYDPAWINYHVSPHEEAGRVEEAIRRLAKEHLRGVENPEVLVVPGHPIATIARMSKEEHIDLIVMGTYGRRGWRRALVGSVADGVAREAEAPVLVVPKHHERPYVQAFTRIVCPVNFSDAARDAVQYAAAVAKAFSAELILVHVVENLPAGAGSTMDDELFHSWLPPDLASNASVRHLVLRGGPAERVLDCVEDLNADLLVVGAQLRWLRSESVIGTTSERLLRFSTIPILTVTRRVPETAGHELFRETHEAYE